MSQRGRQIPWFIWVVAILGVIVSTFLVVTETNVIFKQDKFTERIVLEPETTIDGGYLRLVRNEITPSVLEWANFENGEQYIFFSISEDEIIEEKVYFNTPELDKGLYYIDWESRYLSGKVEKGTISFRVI